MAFGVSAPALGQEAPAEASVSDGDRVAAQDAHRHALELFDRGQHAEALAEFKRAFGLAPSFRIQYNIGLCYAALGDAAAAVEAFSSYLHGGAERIPAPRRQQVEAEITRLSKLLAWLRIEAQEPGAEVSVDGSLLGQGPVSRQLRLNTGRHTVAVRSSDGTLKTQTVTLGAGEEQALHFDAVHSGAPSLAPPPSSSAPDPKPSTSQRQVPWLAWGVTGALGVTAGVTGVLALGARSDEKDAHAREGVKRDDLISARDKVENLALATDILLATTALAAGVSVWLTLRSGHAERSQTSLSIAPGALTLRRSF
jgi:hypothetical protein